MVTVKVPAHAELIRAALSAGTHVLSEWPFGLAPAEATTALRADAADLRDGGRRVAGFTEAVRAHRVLDAVKRSARAGSRVTV